MMLRPALRALARPAVAAARSPDSAAASAACRHLCGRAMSSNATAGPLKGSLAASGQLRAIGVSATQRRGLCSEPSSSSGDDAKATSPKVAKLVEEISTLTLLEAAELTEALKEKLGITSAMMAPAGGGGGGGGGAAAAPAEAAPAAEEKTHFTIKLEAFDAGSKIKLIKEVRAYTGLGLKEAKELVESAPAEVKASVPKEEAEDVKAKFEGVGGTVKLE
jgi:large subunit ribosomal protein L7/L12